MPDTIDLSEIRRLLELLAARGAARPAGLRIRRVADGWVRDGLLKADGSLEVTDAGGN